MPKEFTPHSKEMMFLNVHHSQYLKLRIDILVEQRLE